MDIDKNIHMVFLRKGEMIPSLFKECERAIRNMHPSWNITLWDEEAGMQFLRDTICMLVHRGMNLNPIHHISA